MCVCVCLGDSESCKGAGQDPTVRHTQDRSTVRWLWAGMIRSHKNDEPNLGL